MTTELTIHEGNALTLRPEQSTFNEEQRAVLAHMGVKDAPEPDLMVFAHVCQRTGLDPFARQIHMIGRNSRNQRTDQWETKYTIQTGIDGYRLIGRRAADQAKATISIGAPEWAHEDGSWRPVWVKAWGMPVAARVTIMRNGEPFTAVAMFDEYAQTKRGGDLNSMWSQRPAGQIAKCAEALAWRMAFPQDLSGIYVDDEMHQADAAPSLNSDPKPQGLAAVRAAVGVPEPELEPVAEVVETGEVAPAALVRKVNVLLKKAGYVTDEDRFGFLSAGTGRQITSSKDLTTAEAEGAIGALESRVAELQVEPERTDDGPLPTEGGA